MKRLITLLILSLFTCLTVFNSTSSALNDSITLNSIVSTNPVDWTPEVPGTFGTDISSTYEVRTLAPQGTRMFAGGFFPQVNTADGSRNYNRGNIFAFDAKTGTINTRFKPCFDGAVNSIVPTSDGTALYVAGEFKSLNGVRLASPFIAKINSTTGALVSGFNAPVLNGKINHIDVVRGNLIIGGKFTAASGLARTGLISINSSDGKLNNYVTVQMKDAINPTSPVGVYRFAISPDKSKMAVAGSFRNVDGQSRLQLFILNLNSKGSSLANWDAPILHNDQCSNKPTGNAAFIEDLDFNSESTKLFLADGGGPKPGLCDAAAKFDVTVKGTNVRPDWVSKTKGDTLRSIEWTKSAVYVAGHQRWLPNSKGNLVDRPGIGALDPNTGYVLSWDPGKGREIGSKELIVTNNADQPGMPTGLWVGSDSGQCGFLVGEKLSHQGICFFPSR